MIVSSLVSEKTFDVTEVGKRLNQLAGDVRIVCFHSPGEAVFALSPSPSNTCLS